MTAFATPAELGDYLGQTIADDDERALLLLGLATAAVQAYTNQILGLVEDDVAMLVGNWSGRLELPERPVVSVASVVVNSMGANYPVPDFQLRPEGVLLFGPSIDTLYGPDPDIEVGGRAWGGPNAAITVTYTHGYDPLPDAIKLATLSVAARLWERPDAPAQSVGYASAGGAVAASGLTDVEQGLLRAYRIAPMAAVRT